MNSQENVFGVFFVIWVSLGIASTAFFLLSRNAQLKRKVWRPLVIGVGALFVLFLMILGIPTSFLIFFVAIIVAITVMNLRAVKFCDACGKTLMHQGFFSPPKFCPKCGAPLP